VLRELEELRSGDNYWALGWRYQVKTEKLLNAVLDRQDELRRQERQREAERLFREMLRRKEVLVKGSPFADLPEQQQDRWLPLTPESLKLAIDSAVGDDTLKAALERLRRWCSQPLRHE